jgi:hypothetical protein
VLDNNDCVAICKDVCEGAPPALEERDTLRRHERRVAMGRADSQRQENMSEVVVDKINRKRNLRRWGLSSFCLSVHCVTKNTVVK